MSRRVQEVVEGQVGEFGSMDTISAMARALWRT